MSSGRASQGAGRSCYSISSSSSDGDCGAAGYNGGGGGGNGGRKVPVVINLSTSSGAAREKAVSSANVTENNCQTHLLPDASSAHGALGAISAHGGTKRLRFWSSIIHFGCRRFPLENFLKLSIDESSILSSVLIKRLLMSVRFWSSVLS